MCTSSPMELMLVATLKAPACSVVWCLSSRPQCCVRVQAYDHAITAQKAAANQQEEQGLPDGLRLEDSSVLLQPGSKDGVVKVIRENGAGVAYSWSAARCEAECWVPCNVQSGLWLATAHVPDSAGTIGRRLARSSVARVIRSRWAARCMEARSGTTSSMWMLKRVQLPESCRPIVARIHTSSLTAF